ncbi:twin-arginine translocase TatA/TatE family subunit [Dechloromonas sp. ARDL1]|nr:twin-arginine translocase TatA/TatE family subunit [uncultured Dechloromonas sp.]
MFDRAIILLIFGTKRLPNIDLDLGRAVRGFKEGAYEVDSHNRDKT